MTKGKFADEFKEEGVKQVIKGEKGVASLFFHRAHNSWPNSWFSWIPPIPSAKDYDVYAWWPAHPTHPSWVTFRVFHTDGSTGNLGVNQRLNGAQWNLLGTFPLAPNQGHSARIWGEANGVVVADAVALVPTDAGLPTATWQPTISEEVDWEVYANWVQWTTHATNAPYTIFHKTGSTSVLANQQLLGGQWNLLGTFTFQPNEDHRIELTNDQADGTVVADAIAVVPPGAPPNTATWTPAVTVPDHFEVYAQWPEHATHPSNAPYAIHHAGGSTTVYANQQTNGGQWNLLATVLLQPGQNHRVEVTDEGNGTVVADAVKFMPVTSSPNAAIWTPTIATSDSYRVYTRWTSHLNRATDATYTVYHQGGSSAVVVNQQENGGEWNLLGTYNFDPASNHRIELSEEGNGVVVADAVYVVPASAAANSVTWEPTLASSELVDVYAKWVDDGDRSELVAYTVHHAGGSTTTNVNQRTNGGVWNWLGKYTMNPSSNHRVVVTDSSDGTVAADAVRFVSVTTSGAGLMYVHADHLGTPQKMTDESQALVWDAVFEPFGEVHSITGTATNNQRFPGQYFDSESGFAYNYFRDYDPSTGRYVQSDPIGLAAGLNTYGYVGGNPLLYVDPTGELRWPKDIYNEAKRAAEESGLPGRHNGPQDAYRHCLASCEFTRENGEPAAQCFAWANEKAGDWGGQEKGERAADDRNNAIGMGLGNSAQSTEDCKRWCRAAVDIGVTTNYYEQGSTEKYSLY